MLQRRIASLLSVLALLALVFSPLSGPAQGQQSSLSAGQSPLTTGGPDEYGYTWDDSETFSWLDANGGIDTGIHSPDDHSGPIDIGFPFKYYENSYTQVYAYGLGYLAFNPLKYSINYPGIIPSPDEPNEIVAPFWEYFTSLNGYVRYLKGGEYPNRWFAIEWNHMASYYSWLNEFTFEVILFESSNKILFQYDDIDFPSTNCLSGIENSDGTDGLMVANCTQIYSYRAVGINRPAPSAHVSVSPLNQGGFAPAGGAAALPVSIKNTGELGADKYDLIPSTGWTISLYAADGATPLTDTDGDGTIDTGPVAQDSTVNIVAKVQAPPGAQIGDANSVSLTVRSALNAAKTKTVNFQAAVPAPFTQAFQDAGQGGMSLYLVQPGGQQIKNAVPNWNGYEGGAAEAPDGNFIYAWHTPRFNDSKTAIIWEIEYTIVNKYGEMVKNVTKLLDNSDPTIIAYDNAPVMAVTPDGKIGILWAGQLTNASGQSNYNVYLAVLDPSGNTVFGPASVTNNSIWGSWNQLNNPSFNDPAISATGDNHFVMAWNKYYSVEPTGSCTSSCSVNDIYYAVRESDGNPVKEPAKMTADTSNSADGYIDANLAALAGNRAILSWDGSNSVAGMYYAVIDSLGNLAKASTYLGGSGRHADNYDPDAVQLSDGKTILAWIGGGDAFIRYVMLDADYNVFFGPGNLSNPLNRTSNYQVSVSADTSGHAILTWLDSDLRRLYYALVNSDGSVRTQPMIFYTALPGKYSTQVVVRQAYGNTSYSSFPAGVDASISLDRSWYGGAPGGVATVDFHYANHGGASAAGVTLTATLDSHLAYLDDTSGVTPTFNGSQVTWHLPNLGFQEEGHFTLQVKVSETASIGAGYPLTLALTSDGPEYNPADNTTVAQVTAGYQTNMPVIRR